VLETVDLALARSPTGVFTRVEVAAWVGGTADAEAALVKRALAAGEVIRICRGLYCLGSRYRDRPVDSLIVAQMIMGPSYVSLEAALAFHGWLTEAVETVTSACDARGRRFQTPIGGFSFDRVPQHRLFAGVCRVPRADGQAALVHRSGGWSKAIRADRVLPGLRSYGTRSACTKQGSNRPGAG